MDIGFVITLINIMTLILIIKGLKKGTIKFTAKNMIFGFLITIIAINLVLFIIM